MDNLENWQQLSQKKMKEYKEQLKGNEKKMKEYKEELKETKKELNTKIGLLIELTHNLSIIIIKISQH